VKNFILAVAGEIRHKDYGNHEDLEWSIPSVCERVRITSSEFQTESGYDYVIIDGTRFSGTSVSINVTISKDTKVYFHSDGGTKYPGFVLHWTCDHLGILIL